MPSIQKTIQSQEDKRRIAIAELSNKLKGSYTLLVRHRISYDSKDISVLRELFGYIQEQGKIFELGTLCNIGGGCLELLMGYSSSRDDANKYYSTLIKYYALAYTELEKLNKTMTKITPESLKMEMDTVESPIVLDEYLYGISAGSILSVDDDPAILSMMESVLREEGYNLYISDKPLDVINVLKHNKIDLVLLDVMMPGITGFELFKNIRATNIKVPIIFVTSESTIKDKVTGLELGAYDYILKPFNDKELIQRVEKVLKSENKKSLQRYNDPLTDAFSKAFFTINFKTAKQKYVSQKELFSTALLDIEHFNQINNLHGYGNGNTVLRAFVSFFKKKLASQNQIYRVEDDAFLILFPNASSLEAKVILDEVRLELKDTNLGNHTIKEPVKLSFSAGVTQIEDEKDSMFQILDRGKTALLKAKSEGNGRGAVSIVNSLDNKKDNTGKKLLIVDDATSIIFLIKARFETLGYDVSYATDGQLGMAKIKTIKPNVLILDLMMPGMDGFEVIHKIKQDTRLSGMKIIVVSGQTSKDMVKRCIELGINGFMSKPFSLMDLEDRISKLSK